MRTGNQKANGSWNEFYAVQIPFSFEGRQFFFGHNTSNGHWFIQELLAGGGMGGETDNGNWNGRYASMFSFTTSDGRQFLYGQSQSEKNWFIQEVLPGGKMGTQTASGSWNAAYPSNIPLSVGGYSFFLGSDSYSGYGFIQQLEQGGQMGSEISNFHNWSWDYQLPLQANNTQYVVVLQPDQDVPTASVCGSAEIVLPGTMTNLNTGLWAPAYGANFVCCDSGKYFLFSQIYAGNKFAMQELFFGNGRWQPGPVVQTGEWGYYYPVMFNYEIGGQQYFYAQSGALNWFTMELLSS